MQVNGNYKGLFITDLDGTLLTNDRTFNSRDLLALKRLQKKGYATAIATGRSQYSFSKLITNLRLVKEGSELAINYVVFSTGAGVMEYPGGRIVESSSLDEREVKGVATFLDQRGLDYMIHSTVPHTHYFKYSLKNTENEDFHRRLAIYPDYASPISPEELKAPGDATELLCIVPGECGESLTAEMRRRFPRCSVILATSPLDGASAWIEIFSQSVSKSSAVERLCSRIGVLRKDTCAVGNDYNDEDLLRWSPNSYLVENGPVRLKELFPLVPSNEEAGVSHAIERWLRIDDRPR